MNSNCECNGKPADPDCPQHGVGAYAAMQESACERCHSDLKGADGLCNDCRKDQNHPRVS